MLLINIKIKNMLAYKLVLKSFRIMTFIAKHNLVYKKINRNEL